MSNEDNALTVAALTHTLLTSVETAIEILNGKINSAGKYVPYLTIPTADIVNVKVLMEVSNTLVRRLYEENAQLIEGLEAITKKIKPPE